MEPVDTTPSNIQCFTQPQELDKVEFPKCFHVYEDEGDEFEYCYLSGAYYHRRFVTLTTLNN